MSVFSEGNIFKCISSNNTICFTQSIVLLMKGTQLARSSMLLSRLLVSRALTKQIITLFYFINVAPDYECMCVYYRKSINQHTLSWLRKRKYECSVSLTSLLTHTLTGGYLWYLQTSCLGDHSLFRCVVKETKMEEKSVG